MGDNDKYGDENSKYGGNNDKNGGDRGSIRHLMTNFGGGKIAVRLGCQ